MASRKPDDLPTHTRTILVVEDNDINRETLCTLLQDDFDIIEASNGVEGIEQLKKHYTEISLVLLDVYMPECDGFEFLRFRQSDERYSNIPVIVTTVSSSLDDEIECLKLGSNDFVVKPYDVEIILNRIRNTIKLRETASIVNQLTWDNVTNLYREEFFFQRVDDFLANYPTARLTSSAATSRTSRRSTIAMVATAATSCSATSPTGLWRSFLGSAPAVASAVTRLPSSSTTKRRIGPTCSVLPSRT